MAISDAAWDGSASNYKDTDAYCAACGRAMGFPSTAIWQGWQRVMRLSSSLAFSNS